MKSKVLVPLILMLILLTASVMSLPRLAIEHATPCKTCHVNPNGQGMRNEFGNYSVALNELVLPQTKASFVKHYKKPRLSESLTFGFDSRYLVLDDGYVFRMQTDVFLNAEPFKDLNYHFRIGEDPFGLTGVFENYGLLYLKDKKYYAKLGRFYPAYGLTTADHKAYVQERTGHGSNVYLDGLSFGGEFGEHHVALELFNPNRHAVFGLHMFKTGFIDPVGYMGGFSVRIPEDLAGSSSGFHESKAFFGGLSYDRFTLMGEFDISGRGNDTLIVYGNLTTRLEYGLYLIGEYNFFDGNRDYETGVDEFYRLSLEIYPIPFVEFRPSFTRYLEGPLAGENDFFMQFHVGY